jgi:NAD(P)-dependent dehydrogenase (short-subunit alcohol dehydrogenase family)
LEQEAMTAMQDKVVLVTGSNTGIGQATALGLAKMGATVLMHGRDREKTQAALAQVKAESGNPQVELFLADLSRQAEVRRLAAEVLAKHPRLDVLINNAALMPSQRQVGPDGLEMQLAINHLAYFLLTQLMLDAVKASPQGRIVNVASNIHLGASLDLDNLGGERNYGFGGTGQYGRTKLMNVMFSLELAQKLAGTAITCNSLHPGVIKTQLLRDKPFFVKAVFGLFSKSAEDGAATSLHLASSEEGGRVTGKYFSEGKITPHNPQADDAALRAKLWQVSAEMTGLA